MHLSKAFLAKLQNPASSFSGTELEDGLRLTMVDFIEERIEIKQLLRISERLRKDYSKKLSKKFLEAVNELHLVHEDLHEKSEESVSKEDIVFMIDDLLNSFT